MIEASIDKLPRELQVQASQDGFINSWDELLDLITEEQDKEYIQEFKKDHRIGRRNHKCYETISEYSNTFI